MHRITIKRINGEIKMFMKNKPDDITIYHNPENILHIYFKFKGNEDSIYKNGEYICKIIHNPEYPLKAPDLFILTPNGRFIHNTKLCLTNTSYHQETWAPAAWNLETFINGFINVFHSDSRDDRVGIGHIGERNETKIINLAKESVNFNENLIKTYNLKFI